MKKIMDDRGNIVHGMLRGDHGEIVINDPQALNAYRSQKNMSARLTRLEDSVSKMSDMLALVLNQMDKQVK